MSVRLRWPAVSCFAALMVTWPLLLVSVWVHELRPAAVLVLALVAVVIGSTGVLNARCLADPVEPVPGGCPPSPGTVLARQVHPTRGLSDDVCRRICTELEGQFVEDDTARRTTLNREDGD